MAIRLAGRLTISNGGSGTQSSGTVAGIMGVFSDPSGSFLASDVAVGHYLHSAIGPAAYRWRITEIASATSTDIVFSCVFDDADGRFPAQFDASPILPGDAVITEPLVADGDSYVPSQSVLQIPEALVQAVNSTNALYGNAVGGASQAQLDAVISDLQALQMDTTAIEAALESDQPGLGNLQEIVDELQQIDADNQSALAIITTLQNDQVTQAERDAIIADLQALQMDTTAIEALLVSDDPNLDELQEIVDELQSAESERQSALQMIATLQNSSLQLGQTGATAYPGDLGAANAQAIEDLQPFIGTKTPDVNPNGFTYLGGTIGDVEVVLRDDRNNGYTRTRADALNNPTFTDLDTAFDNRETLTYG